MLREDLEAAGIAYRDDSGRVLDFHAFRHTYVTILARSSTPVKVVQTLARHSDPKLTLNTYSHLTVFDTAAALDALPDLTRPPSAPEAARMTGTDGRTLAPSGSALTAPRYGSSRILTVRGGIRSRGMADRGCRKLLRWTDLGGMCRILTEYTREDSNL